MPYCSKCGHQVEEGSKFCNSCGSPIQNAEHSRQTVYEGTIYKCPNCGEVLPSFTSACPSCGYELRGSSSSYTVKNLHTALKEATTIGEKIQLVKTFPIPNNKEDIYELMILSTANFDAGYYVTHKNEDDISDAWLVKINQCYDKAKVSFQNPTELQTITNIYTQVMNNIKQAKQKNLLFIVASIGCIAVGLLLVMTRMIYIQTLGLVALASGIVMLCLNKKQKNNGSDVVVAEPNSKSTNGGFSSWNIGTKILWIILNIYTIGIPAIIYSCNKKK